MKLRAMTVLALGLLAWACGGEDESGTTEDGVTVTPTGTSTLGTFALEVPASVKRGSDRSFVLTLATAEPGGNGGNQVLFDSGTVRVAAGRYCARIESTVSSSRLKTKDCSIVLEPGKTTTYRVSTIATDEDAMAFVRTQTTKLGVARDILLHGPQVEEGWINNLRPMTFATAPGTLTTELRAERASWPKLETTVAPGADAVLVLPREDKVVRVNLGGESGLLPSAVVGGGLRWRWDGAPDDLREYRSWQPLPLTGGLSLWAQDAGHLVFELGGVVAPVSLARPLTTTLYARRIEVTDVTETDDAGKVQTIRGLVHVKRTAHPGFLVWHDAQGRKVDSFRTQQSVFVWAGDYVVEVFYVANGVSKSYSETVHVP